MLNKAAEDSYRKGIACLGHKGRGMEALALFEAALTLDRRAGHKLGQPRYRSYYGMLLALRGGKVRDGHDLCLQAAREEFYNPDMWLNLGRVELVAGHRKDAWTAFHRGLRLAPGHPDLKRCMIQMGIRSRPVLPFLARTNPLNVLMGRLTRRKRRLAAALG